MHFVNPYFLFGLSAIALPVIVHLFNFRRFRRVYFTNVRFIQELRLETQKRSQLRHLLVLLLRILAISCLVFAFAQPYVPLTNRPVISNAQNAVSVFVDNSFSMEARSSKGSLLDEAKNKAVEIASAYKPSDLFQLLTSDFEGRHQRLVTRDEFIDLVNEVKISPSSRKLSDVISRQLDILYSSGAPAKNSYIVSDFQKSITNVDKFKNDTSNIHFLIPLTANQVANLYIDSCWFESPVQQVNQQVKITARIKNTASGDYEKIPIKLTINNNQRAVASFDCKGHGEVDVSLSYTNNEPGIQYGVLDIIDYPITYDDKFYFSYRVLSSISVLCINDNTDNIYLNNLFGKDSAFIFHNASLKSLDYSSLSKHQLIILNGLNDISSGLIQEIRNYLGKGGNVVLLPSKQMNLEAYNNFLAAFNSGIFAKVDTFNTKVAKLNLEHRIFRGVFEKVPENMDLPVVFSHYPLHTGTHSGAEVLLSLENNDPFLVAESILKGQMYILTVPLLPEFSNFGKHAIFVPVFYQMGLLSQPHEKLYYTIGADEVIDYSGAEAIGDNVYSIAREGGGQEFIPENRMIGSEIQFYPHEQIREAGNYTLKNGKKEITGLAFNYDRKESATDCYTSNELMSMTKKAGLTNYFLINTREKPLSMAIGELNKGIRYWKLFVILTLICLAGEVLLLRFWK